MRGNAEHEAALEQHGIPAIDLLVVNLYPFEATVRAGSDFDTCIENIDIGGPAMIRAAAKNHAGVAVVVDPADYAHVLNEIDRHDGTTLGFRKELAAKAFAHTGAYDGAIATWFAGELDEHTPSRRVIAGTLEYALRYGENPHQWAAFYRTAEQRPGVASAVQVQGKELSYNNLNDTDAAYELVAEFDPKQSAAVAIIKHANPCGVAIATTLAEAYEKALACDSVSAFGGIVALNRDLDADAASEIVKIFTEVIIAPDASDEAKGDHRREEESAPAARRRPARPARGRGELPLACRGLPGSSARQRHGRRARSESGDQAETHRPGVRRSRVRPCRRQAREIEHHRLR